MLPQALTRAIDALSRLPGVGPRTAERYAYYLFKSDSQVSDDIASALSNLHADVKSCPITFALMDAEQDVSPLYSDPERDRTTVMVVEEPLDIYIKTWNEKDRLWFSIKDTGLGIKKENVKKIFDKFYRVHTGNVHDVKGFGLGLAYVKKIINLHDGDIKCESELGKGTTFTVSLPILKEDEN